MDEPDPQIVSAARRGDSRAFEDLVRRYQGDVWRLAYHLVLDRSDADDITQEALVRVFRFLPAYRGESRFTTWLFSITRNCALDELRRAQRRRRARDEVDSPAPRHDHGTSLEVREALLELERDLREPVVLVDMFGMPYREVAGILRVPEGTVKSRVHRARRLLIEALGPEVEEEARGG